MALRVIDPGFWTTVQDPGRFGYREFGVPVGGAFDRSSAALANALLGNSPAAAVLEMTFRGGVYEVSEPLGIALAGASMEVAVVAAADRSWTLELPLCRTLRPGERLVMGRTESGLRTYLAVCGGIQSPLRLGSRSDEQPLQRGQLLPTGAGTVASRRLSNPETTCHPGVPIRVLDGPEADRLLDPSILEAAEFRVSSQSDRMGIRLEGPKVATCPEPERLSGPVAPGAIQAAGSQLILLGVACGTMGGYPHVAHVISADFDRVAQLRPGDSVRFKRVSLSQARDLDRAARTRLSASLLRIAAVAGSAWVGGPESVGGLGGP
jgi:biotin-dependent carboxylase-like uncharacterized protein